MALLFFDGFDHYGVSGDPLPLGKWGSTATSDGSVQSTFARTGGFSYRAATLITTSIITKPFVTSGGAIVGVAWYNPLAFAVGDLLQVLEGAIVHVALGVTAGGLLTVKRGSTVLATGTTPLVLNGWNYLELSATIHDTAGAYAVRINGAPEAALTVTGVDTRNGGTGVWDRINLGNGANGQTYFDDFYVCDTSGAAPRNTFLGPVKIETLLPQTDAVAAGSNAGLTPSTGTDHGALVDEPAPNTSDYNSSPTVGLKDTYNYPPLALSGPILGIQTNLYVSKSDAVVRQVCAVVRAGGTDYDGANVSPSTTFGYFSEVRAQNPNTGVDWTAADIAALQAGMKVTA